MFLHSVYFWLKPDLSSAESDKFWESVRALLTIASVRHGWVGSPAEANRPVIDSSYTCALVLVFDDGAGHDSYQVDPIHDKFRAECGPMFAKLVIYDALT